MYFVGTRGLASYLITSFAGHILLNTGMPSSGPMIDSNIRALGFHPEDIRYILSGHAHIDHVGGHAYMKRVSGADIVIMEAEKELLESGGKTDFQYGAYPAFHFEAVKADHIVRDGDSIQLGDITMHALLTAGHTMGSTTWYFDVEDSARMYHIVCPDGTTINPGYHLSVNPSYPGIQQEYEQTFEGLSELKPDIWLSPHTDFFQFDQKRRAAEKEGVKAYVDPAGYRKRIAGELQKFKAAVLREQQQRQ